MGRHLLVEVNTFQHAAARYDDCLVPFREGAS